MMRFYHSEDVCEKLCIQIIFASYNFLRIESCGVTFFPEKET